LAGISLVAVSAASFGTLAIFGRYAYAEGMDVLTILFLRFSLSAVVMVALLLSRRQTVPRGPILMQLLGMGAIGYVGQAFSYFTALKYASAGLVALLLYLYPLFVAILSAVLLHTHITRAKRLALALALAGTALTVGPQGGQILGALLAISAAAIYSVYIIVGSQVMKQVSAIQSSTVIFAAAGAVFGPTVLIATVLPVVTFLAGLERIGPTNAAMLSTLEPVVTVLLAAWLLGEGLQQITLLGGGLILIAVVLVTHSELDHKAPVLAGD
jgi:drug/metabolite transporter (DMT)-like permease